MAGGLCPAKRCWHIHKSHQARLDYLRLRVIADRILSGAVFPREFVYMLDSIA